jgi:hypothetical protein
MERLTKLLVFGWTCAALAIEIYFLRDGWRALPLIAAVACGAACIATALNRRAAGAVLLFTYVFPTLIYAAIGRVYAPYAAVWMAALVGAMTPSALTSRWHLSTRWRAPLVCWALTVVVGASIVVAREFDFNPDLIAVTNVSNSSIGLWPSYVVSWTLHVAVVNVIGILWFDWLSQLDADEFRATVIAPLGLSGGVLVAVAIYQLLVDVRVLNPTVYAGIARATGTVLDSNVCGVVAAMWIGGAFLLMPEPGVSAHRTWKSITATAAVLAGWLAVWATGSRTGFAAAIIVTLFGSSAMLQRAGQGRAAIGDRRVLAGVAVAVVLLAGLALAPLGVVGPLQRVRNMVPTLSAHSLGAFSTEMWNRNGYGGLANVMIGYHPWVGVGAGAYHVMLADFSQLSARMVLPPDNAQNWLRHQVVEFGVLGSIGCVAWLVAFVPFVLRRRRGEPVRARIPRGMLIAFTAVSMVGVPSQDVVAGITFWTAAFWYVSTLEPGQDKGPLRWVTWAALVLAVAIYAAPMAVAAATTLRVPQRAQRVGWGYAYGFYPPEPDGLGGQQRWTGRHAVAVIDAPTRYLSLAVAVDPLGVNRPGSLPGKVPPVDVRVWVDRKLVVDSRVNDNQFIDTVVTLPPGEERVMIETRVSRTFRPGELGLVDNRELGLLTRWRFLSAPPEPAPDAGDRARP